VRGGDAAIASPATREPAGDVRLQADQSAGARAGSIDWDRLSVRSKQQRIGGQRDRAGAVLYAFTGQAQGNGFCSPVSGPALRTST